MKRQSPPFDPNEFARWFVDGLKETISYRVKQTLSREKIMEGLQTKIPSRNQMVHHVLRLAFEKNGFQFENIKQGDANFHLIRKKFRPLPPGRGSDQEARRLVLIPGFGDSPASWIPAFGFSMGELARNFDEILIVDFPGYMGFLSGQTLVPSMAVLLGLIRTVLEANPASVVVGHSLGGWLAARVLQELPRPIDHLILIAPSGLIPEDERQAFADLILSGQGMTVEELMERVMHEPKKYHQLLQEEILAFYSKPEVRELVLSVTPSQFVDVEKTFRTQKMSVIWGEGDRFVSSRWLRYWVEHYGDILNAYVIKKAGHLLQFERPKVLMQVVFNAILDRPADEGSGWKKIHQRKKVRVQLEARGEAMKLLT